MNDCNQMVECIQPNPTAVAVHPRNLYKLLIETNIHMIRPMWCEQTAEQIIIIIILFLLLVVKNSISLSSEYKQRTPQQYHNRLPIFSSKHYIDDFEFMYTLFVGPDRPSVAIGFSNGIIYLNAATIDLGHSIFGIASVPMLSVVCTIRLLIETILIFWYLHGAIVNVNSSWFFRSVRFFSSDIAAFYPPIASEFETLLNATVFQVIEEKNLRSNADG